MQKTEISLKKMIDWAQEREIIACSDSRWGIRLIFKGLPTNTQLETGLQDRLLFRRKIQEKVEGNWHTIYSTDSFEDALEEYCKLMPGYELVE